MQSIKSTTVDPKAKVKPLKTAACLLAVYVATSAIYIIGSSALAKRITQDIDKFAYIEQIKGLGFITLTGGLLFYLSYQYLHRIKADGDRLQSQQDLILESERKAMAGVFSASIAHDANNLLATLTISVEMLQHKYPSTREEEEIKHIENSVTQLIDLNRRLMNVGRDQLANDKVAADLTDLTRATLELAQSNTKLKRCKVSTLIEDNICVISNPSLYQRTLLNLLLNAAEATNERGQIRLVLERENQQVRLVVEDDGPGIDKEQRRKIFEPFYTTKSDGNGLGLLAVKACADIHQGTIKTRESSLGGAAFIMEFPEIPVPADEVIMLA